MRKSEWTEIRKKYKIYSTKKYNQIKRTYPTPRDFEDAVNANTYFMLICYLEKTFKVADELALSLKPSLKQSLERCIWAVQTLLKKNESDGNTIIGASKLARMLYDTYPELMPFIKDAVNHPMFHFDNTKNRISLSKTWKNEKTIADTIKEKLKSPTDSEMNWQDYKKIDDIELTDEQVSLLKAINENNIVMLNGCAGSGKTTVVKALVKMLDDNAYRYTLLAPTGIAAKRLRQTTGKHAKTIHMHLACLDTVDDFLIIDECSMIGVNLLGSLFSTLNSDVKIVLICDEAQLASISCGNIVQDIIDSNIIPIINLTKIFRYGIGGIETVATDIRNGKPLEENEDEKYNDYTFIPISSNPVNDVLITYKNALKNYNPEDIMILSPFNVRMAGTYILNSAIQKEYNDNPTFFSYKKQGVEIEFKIGDRIINTENNYHMQGEYGDISIMNGDIGKIIKFDGENTIVEFDSGIAILDKNDMVKMLLANAISVHKSQGNQAKCVIVVLDSSHDFFLNRNIEYVAVSRAQEKLIVIGDIDTINNAMKIQQEKNRETNLKNMLLL